jgi:hypothetical protein
MVRLGHIVMAIVVMIVMWVVTRSVLWGIVVGWISVGGIVIGHGWGGYILTI